MTTRTRTPDNAVGDWFYAYMALLCVAIAFLGFAPTYWVPLIAGTFKAHPLIHLHGLIFFGWTLFFAWQAWLAARKQLRRHRAFGLLGVSLATTMTIMGVVASIYQMKVAAAAGMAEAGRTFAIVPLAGMAFFAVVVGCAIGLGRRAEWHKRLMLVGAVSILDAAIARWFIVFLAPPGPPGPPPVFVTLPPAFITVIILLGAMAYDWRRAGRPHPAYIVGAGSLLAMKLAQVPFSESAAWHVMAGALLALAG